MKVVLKEQKKKLQEQIRFSLSPKRSQKWRMVCILISPSNWQWNGWDEQWLQCTMGTVCLLIQMKLSSHYAIIFCRISHRYFPIQSARLHFRQNTFRKKKIVYSSCTALQQCGGTQQLSTKVFICSFRYLPVHLAHSSRHPGCHQGFLAAVLAFPLGPVLIWVISTSVKASGGRHERMRSMVLW